MKTATNDNAFDPVHISVAALVGLNRDAASISLSSGAIRARYGGDYHSPFKGRGMEFDESRPYQHGDDIRNIDWRVTARTNETHTKLFREERERPVFVWVDFRRPMFFATRGSFKAVIAARLASLIAWSANFNGDRTGGVVFSENVHHELKPQRGKTGVLRLINNLVKHPAWQHYKERQTDKRSGSKALARLRRVARPGSMIFLLSDFRNLDDIALSQITTLSRNNDVVMIYIYDLLEKDLPGFGQYRVSDGEEELIVDTFDRTRVEKHHTKFITHLEQLQNTARQGRARLLTCATTEEPVAVLKAGL